MLLYLVNQSDYSFTYVDNKEVLYKIQSFAVMAQAQLDAVLFSIPRVGDEGITELLRKQNSIVCIIDDRHSFVVKRGKLSTDIVLKKGSQNFKIPLSLFETFCDLKLSVQFLASVLEGGSKNGKSA